MLFSSLALMFAGMTFNVLGQPVSNNSFTRTDLYGGSVVKYSYDVGTLSATDYADTDGVITCSLTGRETHLEDEHIITVDTTYDTFFTINIRYESNLDSDEPINQIYFMVRDFEAVWVAPSLFLQLDINQGQSLYTTRTLSSYDQTIDEEWSYELSSNIFDLTLNLYFVYTFPYDPYTMITESDYYAGYEQGYNTGNQTGYTTGYTDGYNIGNTDGYTSGFNTGSASGYQDGYADALSTHSFTFTNLFGSIADTPILIIRRLFGFELFGVGLISVFMSLFTALIVIHLIKKVF